MGTQILTLIMLVVFFAVMIGVGLYCRRHSTNVDGFVLGGRSVGPWLTAFAYGTSYFSAVIFVGYAGQFGWAFGMSSTWIGLGNAFIGSLLAWVVLGRRTRVMTQHLESKTMPDFFQKRYKSNALKIAASFIVFIFLIPYTASLYNGLSSLFTMAFDVPYWSVILIMAVLTGIYVIFGGYMATAVNDFIQGIIMLVGIVAVIGAVLHSQGGFMEAYSALGALPHDTMQGAFSSFVGPDPIFLFFVVMLTSLGTWGLPQMIGKFYSIKNEEAINKGTIISTAFAIIVAGGCYFLGGFGRLFDSPDLYVGGKLMNDKIIPSMLSELSPVIVAIVIVLVLAASMSTLSSLVLTSSSTLTLDVIVPGLEKNKKSTSEKKKLLILRLFIVFFIVVSAVIAIVKDMFPGFTFIAQMMGVSWGALAGAFLAPFLYGLYWKKTTKSAVAVSFIFGTGIELVQLLKDFGVFTIDGGLLGFIFRNSLYSGVFAMLGGLILVPIISLITPKLKKEDTDEMFSCYHKEVKVLSKESLGK
ncbi:MAG: sodium:solute symporter [Ruminococcaceae bacterium]|nr:sodium:solute symporter [Oscillospiraceae bacterium]